MRGFISLVDKMNKLAFNFLAILFGLIAVLTIYQVFARYVLDSPLVWSEELVRYSMIWIVLLGTGVALRKGLLISVEVVLYIVPSFIKKIMQCIIILMNVVYMYLLIKYGMDLMNTLQGQTTGALELPVSWLYAALPIGGFYALINCVVVLIELFIGQEKEEEQHGSTIIH
ncbi:TRAP transporter small permease [Bacillus sp. Marseille-Q3570]|uniref:TRAP transporter small permease n=1 Tax=Bacillus sp. Marseille-Q3570 TaxID=2963522 RepID=UPI0021B780B9|nr:TRAP transporter small permease [Bacillus sp. Marseille-Q3570]